MVILAFNLSISSLSILGLWEANERGREGGCASVSTPDIRIELKVSMGKSLLLSF
jgi:hypothetical protein